MIKKGVTTEWVVDERFPAFTLRVALTNMLDITAPPSQNLLKYLSAHASVENERIQLEKLSKVSEKQKKWKQTPHLKNFKS